MLVDQHTSIDLLASELTLGHDLDSAGGEVGLHHLLGGGSVGMGLDEHEGRVVHDEM